MEATYGSVTTEDVVAAYQLFLGREPESPTAITAELSLAPDALASVITASEEFRLYVLKPLLNGGGCDVRFGAVPPEGLRSWTAATFGIHVDELRRASNWALLLLEVLDAVSELPLSDVDRLAVRRMLHVRRLAAEHGNLLGDIETLDEESAEGWALDAANPDRPLVVQLLINGRVAAAATPDRFRRDLQDAYGGRGVFGVRVKLPPVPDDEARSGRPLHVELVEQASQQRLASRVLMRDMQPQIDALTRLADLLEEIKDRIATVEAQLPSAKAMGSFSVRSYDAYRQAYGGTRPKDLIAQREQSVQLAGRPRFLIAVQGHAPPTDFARTKSSLEAQSYPYWSWRGEGGSWRGAGGGAEGGDYVLLIRAGDEIEADALYHLACVISAKKSPPLLLTVDDDEVAVDSQGRRRFASPRLRGAFDPWLMMQRFEADALWIVEKDFLDEHKFDAGDLDFSARLRLTGVADPQRVHHMPRVLHHRAGTCLQEQETDLIDTVRRQLLRSGVRALVGPHSDVLGADIPGALRIHPDGAQARLASVIIPTRDRLDLIRPCLEGLFASRAANATPFEVLVVDTGGGDAAVVRYLEALDQNGDIRRLVDHEPFNWSRVNNHAAEHATGDILVFLNDDTIPISPAWCDELCLAAGWPGVGVAGARLVYGDGTLQHAGVVTGVFGEAAHEGVGADSRDPGYLGRHALLRRVNAVTGACMAVRRECFEHVGGFDLSLAIAYNDVEFCLRAQTRGWDVLYTPQAVFHHFESKTRRFDAQLDERRRRDRQAEAAHLHAVCGERLRSDPFYNPHFERWAAPFTRLTAPPESL